MVFGTTAMAIGGHLMKKAYKWARNNPQAIGRGLNTVSKMISAKHQGLGKFISGAAQVAKSMSNKDSYINKLASAALKNEGRFVPSGSAVSRAGTAPGPAGPSEPRQIQAPAKKKSFTGGYHGSL